MDTIKIHIIGKYYLNGNNLISNREFLYFMQKIAMIFIISNFNIGEVEEVYPINKVILCVFICLISFYGQFITKPFITDDLNQVNLNSNVIMILTLLFALFSAICENTAMKIIFMVFLTCLNCYLIFIIGKSCLTLKLLYTNNSKLLNFINKTFQKFFKNSEFI